MVEEVERTESASGAQARATAGSAWAAAALQGGEGWEAATEAVLTGLGCEAAPDLGIVFIDSRFGEHYAAILQRLQEGLGARQLIGCTGRGVIGPALEAEEHAAISVLALGVPGAALTALAVLPGESDEAALGAVRTAEASCWMLFADPFSINTESLVAALERQVEGVTLLGGMASAHNQAEGTAVFLDGRVQGQGAVLLGLGGVEVHTIVAQGAEPLGRPLTITACEQNLVQQIGSRPTLEVLRELLGDLDEATRQRALQNLLVGLAMDEYKDEHSRGDYLIRNIVGANQESGAIAISAIPRLGQTFQFQFRDAAAADEDLRQRLGDFRAGLPADQVVLGSVLCACNGRGQSLFGVPDHDARAIQEALGPVPTAGLFCNGEIGPVGGRNFLHGFTASIAVLTAPGG